VAQSLRRNEVHEPALAELIGKKSAQVSKLAKNLSRTAGKAKEANGSEGSHTRSRPRALDASRLTALPTVDFPRTLRK
jgi:hypothetical protein